MFKEHNLYSSCAISFLVLVIGFKVKIYKMHIFQSQNQSIKSLCEFCLCHLEKLYYTETSAKKQAKHICARKI